MVEIADGLLQGETAALLRSPAFTRTVDAWLFAAGDPLAALSGVQLLRGLGIQPAGVGGLVTMSPLAMREVTAAAELRCFTAAELQAGALNPILADLAAKRAVVTVEEIVDDFGERNLNAVILPSWTVSAIACVPSGAHPSYAQGYYARDNAFYIAWEPIARDRNGFLGWMQQNVLDRGPEAFAAYARKRYATTR